MAQPAHQAEAALADSLMAAESPGAGITSGSRVFTGARFARSHKVPLPKDANAVKVHRVTELRAEDVRQQCK